MRTDVMIGVVVAGLLAVIFIGWVIWESIDSPQQPITTPEIAADSGQTNVIENPPPPAESAEPDEPALTPPTELISPGYGDLTAPPIDTATARDDTLSQPPPVEPPAERTYVVQEGDTYSSIAQREYGKASLYKVIMDANPNIPARALRPNMTIRIPPAPAEPSTPVAGDGTTAGSVGIDADTGKRFYIVKKTDSQGFWGIAKDIYGHGKHYTVLEKANPTVNPNRLHAGQKIWAPELTAEAPPGPGTLASGTAPPVPTPPAPVRVETGAPARTVMPDGRVFD